MVYNSVAAKPNAMWCRESVSSSLARLCCNGRLFSVIQPHLPIKHLYAMIDWRQTRDIVVEFTLQWYRVTTLAAPNELFTAHQGKYPVSHSKMESFRFLAMMFSWMVLETVGNLAPYTSEQQNDRIY